MLHTTKRLCRERGACKDGYRKLCEAYPDRGDDDPISLLEVLESNGVLDAAWAFRATVEDSDREARLFACLCAESVLPIYEKTHPGDERPRKAIEVARRFASGEATRKELAAARDAAWAAASAAAFAARDARAAARDARAAAWDAELARQEEFLRQVLEVPA